MSDSDEKLAEAAKADSFSRIQAQVQRLIALAEAARSSQNPVDMAAVEQELGSNAMLDQVVAMMQGFVRGDIDNQQAQTNLTVLLAQRKLIEDARTQEVVTADQATKLATVSSTPSVVSETPVQPATAEAQSAAVAVAATGAAQPAMATDATQPVTAPTTATAVATAVATAECDKPAEHVNQVELERQRLAAQAGAGHTDQVAAKRAELAKSAVLGA